MEFLNFGTEIALTSIKLFLLILDYLYENKTEIT
jgi:hypothetical protein